MSSCVAALFRLQTLVMLATAATSCSPADLESHQRRLRLTLAARGERATARRRADCQNAFCRIMSSCVAALFRLQTLVVLATAATSCSPADLESHQRRLRLTLAARGERATARRRADCQNALCWIVRSCVAALSRLHSLVVLVPAATSCILADLETTELCPRLLLAARPMCATARRRADCQNAFCRIMSSCVAALFRLQTLVVL